MTLDILLYSASATKVEVAVRFATAVVTDFNEYTIDNPERT
jgi:hypothetical protein